MAPLAPQSLLLGTLLLLLLSISSLQACTLLGSKPSFVPALSARVPTCTSLNTTGAPIQVPNDTNTTKYGQIQILQLSTAGAAPTATFVDRAGTAYPLLRSALPSNRSALLALEQISPRIIVQAHLLNHTVQTFTPALHVPFTTVLSALKNTQFIGNLTTHLAGAGIPTTQWIRWDFSSKVVTPRSSNALPYLSGQFTNLFNATLDGRVCRPALCSSPATRAYFTQYFGNSSRIMLSWNPAMHGPLDTELVSSFSAVASHMSPFIYLHQLLQPSFSFIKQYNFTIHGNPIGAPATFSGVLSRGAAAKVCHPKA